MSVNNELEEKTDGASRLPDREISFRWLWENAPAVSNRAGSNSCLVTTVSKGGSDLPAGHLHPTDRLVDGRL